MIEVNTVEYFQACSFRESPILSIVHCRCSHTLEIVVDYWAEVVSDWFSARQRGLSRTEFYRSRSYHKDFRRLIFRNATELQCNGISWDQSREIWIELASDVKTSHPSIIWLELGKKQNKDFVSIELSDFEIEVSFDSLAVERRLARCDRVNDELCKYIDVETGEEIDYGNPFNIPLLP